MKISYDKVAICKVELYKAQMKTNRSQHASASMHIF